jgi:dipeptidyl aminopeptidase/acylaminoacyl peptidase
MGAIKASHLADVGRAVIFGHSFGGWTVNCIVTRVHRFRATVSVSGFSDLMSLGFPAEDTATRLGIGGGQTDVGKSIWEATLLYWHESPIADARNVTTPLLLLHGEADNTIPVDQSVEMYRALAQLGKDVSLVTYDGAGHSSLLDLPDYRKRAAAWIIHHLKPLIGTRH